MSEVNKVGIIGAGLMGHGIAQVFAVHGYDVTLMDVKDDLLYMAVQNIRSNLALMANHGIGRKEDIEPAIKRISV